MVVTGAGRGIGQAIAIACAREGADLVVASRTQSEYMNTANAVRSLGRNVVPMCVDVSDKNDVEKMVQTTIQEFGTIDVLVNAAGVIGPIGPFVENDADEWVKTININFMGTALCCQKVLSCMINQGRGKIINFSGGGATFPRPRFSAYASSKSAVVGLTASLAEEFKDSKIQINAVAPGAIFSRLHEKVLEAGLRAGKKELDVSKRARENINVPPPPTQIATECVVFLASAQSDGLTGRLVSAVWDDWSNMTKTRIVEIMSTDLYTLRRIDNVYFAKKN